MRLFQNKFSLVFIFLFSLPIVAQDVDKESKLIQDINVILSNSIGATTYSVSVSDDNLIVNCGYNQTFPMDKIDVEKIKIIKESMQINNQGRKGNLYYLKLFDNQKGNYVYNESFSKKVNVLIIVYSHEQEETIKNLKNLFVELVNNHLGLKKNLNPN
ncbi:hypothetical protein [Flavobacterium sp.]|uniref:hypothetical protein n=1 Tax=Flavobacterium sp. TaxID=239 RepID=UPI00286E585B|nr:hypothetical protein [Flavobacterium sp.]